MRRTQIYLDDGQTARLDQRAVAKGVTRSTVIRRGDRGRCGGGGLVAKGVTRSTVIRHAVDEYLARDEWDPAAWRARWQEAVTNTAGIAPYLPDGSAYVEGLRAADAERLRKLGA